MGLFSRAMTLIKTKINDLLERSEDPRQTLEYSYERQRELLQQVRRGLVEVATSKARLELQAQKIRDQVPKLDDQARRALAAGREDLARVDLLALQGDPGGADGPRAAEKRCDGRGAKAHPGRAASPGQD